MNTPSNINKYQKGTVYIESQVDQIQLSGENLIIVSDQKINIPLNQIVSIVIRGNINITSSIIYEIVNRGITITFLGYYGNYKCTLYYDIHGNIETRYKQYKISDSNEGFKLGRKLIIAKIQNQIAVLNRYIRNYGKNDTISKSIKELEKYLEYAKISLGIEQLLGYEGKSIINIFYSIQ